MYYLGASFPEIVLSIIGLGGFALALAMIVLAAFRDTRDADIPTQWKPRSNARLYLVAVLAFSKSGGHVMRTAFYIVEPERLPGIYFDTIRDYFPPNAGWKGHKMQVVEASRADVLDIVTSKPANDLNRQTSYAYAGLGLRREEA